MLQRCHLTFRATLYYQRQQIQISKKFVLKNDKCGGVALSFTKTLQLTCIENTIICIQFANNHVLLE